MAGLGYPVNHLPLPLTNGTGSHSLNETNDTNEYLATGSPCCSAQAAKDGRSASQIGNRQPSETERFGPETCFEALCE